MKKRNKLLMQREEGQGVITVLYRRADSPRVVVSDYVDLTETVNADGTVTAIYTLPFKKMYHLMEDIRIIVMPI